MISGDSAVEPTINLSGCVHPKQLAQWLGSELCDETNNTGLYSGRFLITVSEPVFPLAEEVEELQEDLPSLERFLYAVSILHNQSCIYFYDDDAKRIINEEYNQIQLFLRDNHHQTFISGKLVMQ